MSDYFNGVDFVFGYATASVVPDGDYEPDYADYLDECDQYAAALDLDLELMEAFADDRIEWLESGPTP